MYKIDEYWERGAEYVISQYYAADDSRVENLLFTYDRKEAINHAKRHYDARVYTLVDGAEFEIKQQIYP